MSDTPTHLPSHNGRVHPKSVKASVREAVAFHLGFLPVRPAWVEVQASFTKMTGTGFVTLTVTSSGPMSREMQLDVRKVVSRALPPAYRIHSIDFYHLS